ncbi:glycoside hydrolase family 65 [Evansella sp. AB-rgal1]|uniref:glycoside hydrolase family 65 n=1 Tax=Evansella sp. AB-rgal1 TaxID=3242696 RepID=UPI00359D6D39
MDKKMVVERHNPLITKVDSLSPLSLGNGEFGFSVDFTGLQTFPEEYETPLGTQSNWGWHYTNGPELYTNDDITFQSFETYGRNVKYPMKPEDKPEAYHWLRQNPHRLQLGRISFRFYTQEGAEVNCTQITNIEQKLNLWTGTIHSKFMVEEVPVNVETVCHPIYDAIGVKVSSPLIKEKRLEVFTIFPNPDITHTNWAKSVQLNYENEDRHSTDLHLENTNTAILKRQMDNDNYDVKWNWSSGTLKATNTHEFTLYSNGETDEIECTFSFATENPADTTMREIRKLSEDHWERFWLDGGLVDFSESTDNRANELERRVVLSQYLCAIHSGGSLPPQETGLMYNSWFGKLHLEMHWWHAAHFPLWSRPSLLSKSMDWYQSILPNARELARSQGYVGARWPKMVGYDGIQTPSPVAPGLIWQQPHPIALAELLYRSKPSKEILEKYKSIVFESADFMASFAHWDEEKNAYVLGPPLIPAQECHRMKDSLNPPYEVEYWKYGLEIAMKWAQRLRVSNNPIWEKIANAMAPLPQSEGVYLAHENCLDTFTEKNHDHPSMVGALGILPGTLVDLEVMRSTLKKVEKVWDWESAWGWDFPMCAMTAARLGEREMAINFLLMDATKNTYLANGHNYQRPGLTAYLPGNGGLLTAVAMMICGWEGSSTNDCPGFPSNGSWTVKWEGIEPYI